RKLTLEEIGTGGAALPEVQQRQCGECRPQLCHDPLGIAAARSRADADGCGIAEGNVEKLRRHWNNVAIGASPTEVRPPPTLANEQANLHPDAKLASADDRGEGPPQPVQGCVVESTRRGGGVHRRGGGSADGGI